MLCQTLGVASKCRQACHQAKWTLLDQCDILMKFDFANPTRPTVVLLVQLSGTTTSTGQTVSFHAETTLAELILAKALITANGSRVQLQIAAISDE